jgi:hypothetical protein
MQDCMEANGFSYWQEPFFVGSVPNGYVDANEAYMASLSADKLRLYTELRWSPSDGSEDASCAREASDRTHLLNNLATEYQNAALQFRNDARVQSVINVVDACITASGDDPTSPTAVSRPKCEREAGWAEVMRSVREEVETQFIADHTDRIIAFLASRPRVTP